MVVSIDILQFQPNWCRITACHAILLIGYYAKNGNPLRAWHFAEAWIWYITFFLSFNVRTGFYIIAMLCELSQHWLHREVLCPIISDKCPFPSTELTEMVSLNLSLKSIKYLIQTPSMAKLWTTGMSCIIKGMHYKTSCPLVWTLDFLGSYISFLRLYRRQSGSCIRAIKRCFR